MLVDVVLFILFTSTLLYLWMKYHYGHWKRMNIPGPEPRLFFGNMAIGKSHIGVNFMNIYKEYKSEPLIGIYLMFRKALLVNDLDLIKNIMIKDHHPYFEGHGFTFGANSDPITQNLFNLEGETWKKWRVKLTPTFTSSKMRMMYEIMYACVEEMTKYVDDLAVKDKVMDYKEVFSRLGTDIIASCAFGIESNSFKDDDAEFRTMGRKITGVSVRTIITFLLSLVHPKLVDTFIPERLPKDVSSFFYKIVRETVEYREKNNVRRNDFLQLLIDLKNSHEKPEDSITLTEMTAHVFVFFIAGFETSSTTSSYALLELCRNKDIRDRLVKEVDEAFEKDGGKISYETLKNMTYLDQVVNETLRMYSPLSFLFRRCTQDYQVPNSKVVIKDGTIIVVPLLGIHRDPDLYPEPLKFDPERFTPENVKNRHPCAHMPFGEGPRTCIGSRFGLMQVKLALCMTLRNFQVTATRSIPQEISFRPRAVGLIMEETIPLRATRRQK